MATLGFKEKVRGLVGCLHARGVEVHTVNGIAFCCAWCNKIRDEQSNWHRIDPEYLQLPDAKISHTICPECKAKYVQEFQQVLQPVPH
jgi:hypothetical protein